MQDLRLAFRNLWRRPSFALIAILTLALGLGANAAVFSVSNAVLLAPLPYVQPEQVVLLAEQTPQIPTISTTIYNYEDWRDRAKSFSAMAAFRPTNVTVAGFGDPERVPAKMITASLLPLLGVSIEKGREFGAADDGAGAEPVVMLSEAFAARRFADQDPVGQVVQMDNTPYTVVGIMPGHFELFQPADVYVPFGPWAATLPEDRGWHPGIFPMARLKDGVTLEEARVEMDGISAQLEVEYPESNKNLRALVTPAQEQLVKNIRPAILLLTGAVALVLLIACANVANLLLARAVDRQKEIAVRIALGAGRLRIVRQLIVESVLLSCIGGAAGLLVTTWVVSYLTGSAIASLPRIQKVGIQWQVVLFALALAVVTGIVFGLVPALHATHTPIRASLNEESRGGSGSMRQQKLRSSLVVLEVCVALVLLVGAGLLVRSFAALTNVPPGFNAANLLVVNLPLSPQKYQDDVSRSSVVEKIVTGVRSLPGVDAAAMTTMLPMAGAGSTIHFNRSAYPPKGPDDYVMAGYRAVTPGYLSTLGVSLQRGRLLTDSDRQGAPKVVVVNESMARQYFPDRDALGQRIQLGTVPSTDFPTMEIVGIVGDMKQSFETGSNGEMFVPVRAVPGSHPGWHVPEYGAGGEDGRQPARHRPIGPRRDSRSRCGPAARQRQDDGGGDGRHRGAAPVPDDAAPDLCEHRRRACRRRRLRNHGLHRVAADAGDRRADGSRRLAESGGCDGRVAGRPACRDGRRARVDCGGAGRRRHAGVVVRHQRARPADLYGRAIGLGACRASGQLHSRPASGPHFSTCRHGQVKGQGKRDKGKGTRTSHASRNFTV